METTKSYPTQYESQLILEGGREVFIRPIKQEDSPLEIDFFNSLSENSKYQRFLRHISSIPQSMLYQFTHVNYNSEFALVALINEDGKDTIIAVARYAYTPEDDFTDLAIVVRDDWQHIGLGKTLLKKIVDIGKEHGINHFTSMIDPQNKIIKKVLSELGYTVEYSIRSGVYQAEIHV